MRLTACITGVSEPQRSLRTGFCDHSLPLFADRAEFMSHGDGDQSPFRRVISAGGYRLALRYLPADAVLLVRWDQSPPMSYSPSQLQED
jgi:hypothetical protein